MSKDIISSIDRALDILMYLYYKQEEMGITDIGKDLGLHKSTVYRTLVTLEKKGFIQQNTENGKYWLGVKLYTLGSLVGENLSLKNLARPYTRELSKQFNEVVNVSILDNSWNDIPKTILVLKEEIPNQILKVNPPEGAISESHYSAVGKCILAFSEEGIVEKFKEYNFPTFTHNTIDTYDDLLESLKDIRKIGYAMDNEELEMGLTCIAVPILNRKGNAIAAISISGPKSRINSHDFKVLLGTLKNTADKIGYILS